MSTYRTRFNEMSALFNKNPTPNNHQAIGQLYELKHELEALIKTNQADFDSDMVLFSVYRTLQMHKSAYQIFIKHHDKSDKNNIRKIYKLCDKATSHGDTFELKDIRDKKSRLMTKEACINLTMDDFKHQEVLFDKEEVFVIKKPLPILGRDFNGIEVSVIAHQLSQYLPTINQALTNIVNINPQILIDFYNDMINDDNFTIQATGQQADMNWFIMLDIYRCCIDAMPQYNSCTMSVGDTYDLNHSLQIEFFNGELVAMSYH